jgi:hypothetical protein
MPTSGNDEGAEDLPPQLPPFTAKDSAGKPLLPKHVALASIAYLDNSILHNPYDSTAWYLRALCYLSLGNERLAARDIRRMQEIETEQSDAKVLRMTKLELVQGKLRVLTNEFAAHVAVMDLSGPPKMLLPDYPTTVSASP